MFHVSAFYHFVELSAERLSELEPYVRKAAEDNGVLGLILLADEGINATIAAPSSAALIKFKERMHAVPELMSLTFKDSISERAPFRRLVLQIREEIVTLKRGIKNPLINPKNRLSPKEWNQFIEANRDHITILDTRNTYETELGMFKGAIDPKIKVFSEFPRYVQESGIPKDKPVLMYCTGGIRCEKAIEEMYAQGYQQVYQLDGGILRYLEECPDQEFEGECFVFDHRVAVDQHLQPSSQYRLCPHCGDPGTVSLACGYCNEAATICHRCAEAPEKNSCSKNCSYHLGLKQTRTRGRVESARV